jgi:glycosyltransferase involved in cell wall biosynthesis
MHETPHGFFHLDHPADGASLLPGAVMLRGWAAGKNGRPLVDLRVRVTDTIHPGIYGFPRPDLAVFFGLDQPFLPGGFEAAVALAPGEQDVIFEVLDIAGDWQAIGTVRLTGQGGIPVAIANGAPGTIQPHEFARALQCTLRLAATTPVTTAAASLVAALPVPATLRYPHVPFHGHLHQPTLLERVLFGRLRIEGWLFHETSDILRVAASVDLQTWQELELGGSKEYVENMFPQFPRAKNCRIDGLIDVPAQLPNPLCVRIYAELADGRWHLCHVQRTHTWDQEQEKIPYATSTRDDFGRACLALDRAARARNIAVPRSSALWRGIRGVYQEFQDRERRDDAGPAPVVPTRPALASRLSHATLITHNLGLEGAPLFLLEFARHLAASGIRLLVISAADGPLAAEYTGIGATVQVVDAAAQLSVDTTGALSDGITALAAGIPLAGTDLVIANTLSAWWGVHLAHRANRPSLFYIHESTTPATFYLGHMAPATLPLIEDTFRLATHVSFLTESTRVYYRPWLGPANHSINPGWIDVPAIDRYLAAHPREELRQKLGLDPKTKLVINVGSICDRKGQHIFSRGVDLLWRQVTDVAEPCRFLMIGGRDTLFDRDLQRLLAQLNRPNLQIIPATSTPLAYYGAADLFVCSSYEESFPRVIMEAMACRVPILSTAVHGIRDLVISGSDGWLIPPGNTQAMAEGLQAALRQPELAAQMALRARIRVAAQYDAAILLPRHAALAATVAGITP